MSLRTLLFGQIVAFLGLLSVVLWATLQLASADGGDAAYINIAGRQRMLSQKAAKEAAELARSPSRAQRGKLEGTLQLFAQSHRALRLGGQTPASLSGSEMVQLQGATDEGLVKLLDEVDGHWMRLVEGMDELMEAAPGRDDAIAALETKAPKVLANMDQAVRYLSAVAKPNFAAIDVAGRQRMLSQRAAFQALTYAAQPNDEALEAVRATIELFEKSHVALLNGGRIALRLDGSATVRLPGAKDERVIDKLQEVKDLWEAEREAIDVLIQAPNAFQTALEKVGEANPVVLVTMNRAVARAQTVAETKLGSLQDIQLGALLLGVVAAVLGGLLVISIGRSLDRLRSVADEISLGQVSNPVPPIGLGEIRSLSQSFERMRFSLQATMEMNDQPSGEASGDSYASIL